MRGRGGSWSVVAGLWLAGAVSAAEPAGGVPSLAGAPGEVLSAGAPRDAAIERGGALGDRLKAGGTGDYRLTRDVLDAAGDAAAGSRPPSFTAWPAARAHQPALGAVPAPAGSTPMPGRDPALRCLRPVENGTGGPRRPAQMHECLDEASRGYTQPR